MFYATGATMKTLAETFYLVPSANMPFSASQISTRHQCPVETKAHPAWHRHGGSFMQDTRGRWECFGTNASRWLGSLLYLPPSSIALLTLQYIIHLLPSMVPVAPPSPTKD